MLIEKALIVFERTLPTHPEKDELTTNVGTLFPIGKGLTGLTARSQKIKADPTADYLASRKRKHLLKNIAFV